MDTGSEHVRSGTTEVQMTFTLIYTTPRLHPNGLLNNYIAVNL